MREEVIKNLINLDRPLDELKVSLKVLSWDVDEQILMSKEAVKTILLKYINGIIDDNTLINWANLIESREDILYDRAFSRDIKQLIFNIANPDLQGFFSKEMAEEWLLKFK